MTSAGIASVTMQVGCKPSSPTSTSEPEKSNSTKASKIPLRVWLVGEIAQPETVIRQWNAVSEQPVEFRTLQANELFEGEKCAADLLLYPARLLGELVRRKWIVKLPSALDYSRKPTSSGQDVEAEIAPPPAAMLAAAKYNSTQYGLPLGYSLLSVLASSASKTDSTTWKELRQSLTAVTRGTIEIDDSKVDAEALVDRYLTIAFGISEVNSKYGVLFDLKTMKPRLTAQEFLEAGEILQGLACQPNAPESVIGSHSVAWSWINRAEQTAFAIASPSQLNGEVLSLEGAHKVVIDGGKTWNSGAGVIASMATQCQQSAQTINFARWLSEHTTLDSLRGQVPGMVSSGTRGVSLAERLMASDSSLLQRDDISNEPRFSAAYKLRASLAKQLILFLKGQSCEQSLSIAANEWSKIVDEQGPASFKSEYEQSLGLQV